MNKDDKPVVIMSDTDYAKLSDMLSNTPASECLGTLLDCIKVVADAKTTMNLMNGAGDTLELEGTEKQIEAFEAERKERNDALFPSCMSFIGTVSLALEHGLTVKKVTTRK